MQAAAGPRTEPVPVGDQIGYLVKRLQTAVRAALETGLRDHGVGMTQYAALAALDEEPGLSGAALARRCFVTPQTMHQVLAGMADAGLVARADRAPSGRALPTHLTDRGRAALAACHDVTAQVHDRMLAPLAPGERAALGDLLRRCTGALEGSVVPALLREPGNRPAGVLD